MHIMLLRPPPNLENRPYVVVDQANTLFQKLVKMLHCILERYQRLIKVIFVGATRRICFYGKIQREFDYLTSSNHS